MPLTIKSLRSRPVLVPLSRPIRTASGSITEAPLVLIDVETSDGPTGRAYLFAYQAMILKPLHEMVRALGSVIVGDPPVPRAVEQKLRSRLMLLGSRHLAGMAISGIEMAVWDSLARNLQLPLVRLLGGQPKPIATYASLGMMPAEEVAEVVIEALQPGFRAVKIRLGFPTLQEDLAVVRAVRASLPQGVELMVDYNQALSVPEAIRRGRALDGEGIYWIEEPTRAEDFAGHARITAAVVTPIMMGENIPSPLALGSALEMNASDFVMPDAQQIGGVSGWQQASALAAVRGVPVSNHLFVELSAHMLAAAPTAHWLEFLDLAGPVMAEPVKVVDGTVTAPERPGIGIIWDEEAVRRYQA